MSRCGLGSRHWFTVYGSVGAKRAICGHCRAIHPDIRAALARGLYYARLYAAPQDSPDADKDIAQQARAVRLLEEALERVDNEEPA